MIFFYNPVQIWRIRENCVNKLWFTQNYNLVERTLIELCPASVIFYYNVARPRECPIDQAIQQLRSLQGQINLLRFNMIQTFRLQCSKIVTFNIKYFTFSTFFALLNFYWWQKYPNKGYNFDWQNRVTWEVPMWILVRVACSQSS